MTYEPRTYRDAMAPADLACYTVEVAETDLRICTRTDLSVLAGGLAIRARADIEGFIRAQPYFRDALVPFDVPPDAPEIVRQMADAARMAQVGPMAAVAGAIAEHVARGLAAHSGEVIVENGGDLYLVGTSDRTVALWAGAGGVRDVGIAIDGGLLPLAVCTSSGTVGHSHSFGVADAVTVLARNGALADAAATALANRVRAPDDIDRVIDAARAVDGLLGMFVTIHGHCGAWGDVRLVALEDGTAGIDRWRAFERAGKG